MPSTFLSSRRNDALIGGLVLAGACLVAVHSARDYAGSWNDGSRLATVETLVDRHTLAIDQSIFVQVPPRAHPADPVPYDPAKPGLLDKGTGDKLFIDGHYYSDKSPVPALWLAGLYQCWRWGGGPSARERPNWFCYLMTLASSGLAYVAAVWCVYSMGRLLRLPVALCLALSASLALSTVALTYARHVNNHILFLGVASVLFLELVRLIVRGEKATAARQSHNRTAPSPPASGGAPWAKGWGEGGRNSAPQHESMRGDLTPSPPAPLPRSGGEGSNSSLLLLGTCAGLGYTIDLGAGPVLLLCVGLLVLYRCRCLRSAAIFTLAALPWLVLHHVVNYLVGGTIKPANAVPEYFQWPGCPFNPENMTGAWHHTIPHFFEYAAALLAGKRGFLGHNLPLFLAAVALAALLWRRPAELPEILCAAGWFIGTWLLYAASSRNYSGPCCSIRWFVPLLAPGYFVLALFLRRYPSYIWDLLVLSAWGAVLSAYMWSQGPWMEHLITFFWPIQAAALLSWLVCRSWCRSWESHSARASSHSSDRSADAA